MAQTNEMDRYIHGTQTNKMDGYIHGTDYHPIGLFFQYLNANQYICDYSHVKTLFYCYRYVEVIVATILGREV